MIFSCVYDCGTLFCFNQALDDADEYILKANATLEQAVNKTKQFNISHDVSINWQIHIDWYDLFNELVMKCSVLAKRL